MAELISAIFVGALLLSVGIAIIVGSIIADRRGAELTLLPFECAGCGHTLSKHERSAPYPCSACSCVMYAWTNLQSE